MEFGVGCNKTTAVPSHFIDTFLYCLFLALNTEEFAFPYSLKQEDQFVVSKA